MAKRHLKRPAWVKCIADPARKGYGLCGRLVPLEFTFVDLEHCRMAEDQGSRVVGCEDCKSKMPVNSPA